MGTRIYGDGWIILWGQDDDPLEFVRQSVKITTSIYGLCQIIQLDPADFKNAFLETSHYENMSSVHRLFSCVFTKEFLLNEKKFDTFSNEVEKALETCTDKEYKFLKHSNHEVVKRNYEMYKAQCGPFKNHLAFLRILALRTDPKFVEDEGNRFFVWREEQAVKSFFDYMASMELEDAKNYVYPFTAFECRALYDVIRKDPQIWNLLEQKFKRGLFPEDH